MLFDLLIEEGGSVPTVYAHHTEKDMNLALAQPWCSIGSDGSAYATEGPLRRGNPHPRNFGTFPRVLGVYVRERERAHAGRRGAQDDLAERRQARPPRPRPAAAGALRRRDGLRPGDGDRPGHLHRAVPYNEGIEYVIVNGQVVLDRGKHTGAMPGKALRRK